MAHEQPTTKRIRLKGRDPLSGTTIHGWPAILFGLLFVIAGFPTFAIGIEWMDYPKGSIHAPLWVVGFCGGIFVSGGLWLMVHGIQGLRRIWNMEQGKRQLSMNPWLWDYAWKAKGAMDNKLKSALGSLIVLIVFSVFLAPFNWIAFVWKDSSFFWQGIVGLLDLVIVVGVGSRFLNKLRQYLMFGNAYLAFNSFPFFLGKPMSLTLNHVPPDIPALRLDLRCLQEAYEIHGTGEDRKSVVVCYQIYKDSHIYKKENFQPGGNLHLSFNLPDNKAFSSTPSERPAKYWELEVTAKRPDVNYQSRFLLPIYAQNS